MKEGIFKVTDPSSLRTIKGNRAIKMPHVARIMSSMKTKPMLKDFPILLTKNNEVLDGQHRLQAAIKLGIPIYAKYAEEMTKKEIPAINSISMKWSKIEYLNMYCDFGLLPYQKLSAFFDYAKGLNIGFGVVGAIFMKTKQTTTGVYQCGMLEKKTFCVNNWAVFECGGFEYPEDDSFAYGYIDFIKELKNLYSKFYAQRSFLLAALMVYNSDGFDIDRFRKGAAKTASTIIPARDVNAYIDLFEDVYNYGQTKNNIVRFDRLK